MQWDRFAQVAQQSDAESKAQQFAATRMSEALYANESGSALMR
jgi:rubrerythrin